MEIITDKATAFMLVERCYAIREKSGCGACVLLEHCAEVYKDKAGKVSDFLYVAEEVKADG